MTDLNVSQEEKKNNNINTDIYLSWLSNCNGHCDTKPAQYKQATLRKKNNIFNNIYKRIMG